MNQDLKKLRELAKGASGGRVLYPEVHAALSVVGNMVKKVSKKQAVWVFVGHCKGFGFYSE